MGVLFKMILSIIVPCYNEEETVSLFYNEVEKQEEFFQKNSIEPEFIFVDDGSRDKTVEKVKALREKDKRVHLISFSRNFGKEAAIFAGLERASGELVTLMDADLQDPPALLPEMYSYIQNGYDVAATRRVDRKGEPPVRSWFARRFYALMRKISTTDIVDGARDFRMMTRKVVDAVLAIKEYNRFSKGIFGWVGFKTRWLEYENIERAAGETKWSFWKLFLYSLEGIMAFSTAPLLIPLFLGIMFLIAAVVLLVISIVLGIGGNEVAVQVICCVVAFAAGVQMCCLGIVGMYFSKIYLEVKNRPKYLVREEF